MRDLTLRLSDGTSFSAMLLRAAGPPATARVGVVILPDARGLHPDDAGVARRFSAAGIDALVVDHFGRTAGARNWQQPFDWEPHFVQVRSEDVAQMVAAAAAYLRSPEATAATAIACLGFGFGGMQALLQAANGHGLAGVAGVGGRPNPPLPDGSPAPIERVTEFTCPVLGLFGWLDPTVSPTWLIAFEQALAKSSVPHELVVYRHTGAGFMDRRLDEFPDAAADGWRRTIEFVRALAAGMTPPLARYVVVGEPLDGAPPVVTAPAPLVASEPYFPPPESRGGWRTLTDRREIAARGLDVDRLDELTEWMGILQYPAPYPPSPWGFLVIKAGWIVAESYDQPATRYRPRGIASCGKSLSSLAFGQWVEAGRRGDLPIRLELDSSVYDRRILPEGFPLSDPRKEAITFRQVLTHTSGLKPEWDTRGGEGFRFADYTVGRLPLYPDSATLAFDPGTSYGYSGVGFNHFSVIAPHVAGKHLYQQVRDDIFAPIGAESAVWRLPDGEYFAYEDPNGEYMPGSGGPHVTTRDLARYAYLHLHLGQWDGRCVVPAWYMEEARKVTRLNDAQPTHYGLGFGTNDQLGLSADLPRTAFMISGNGLNMALVVPDWDLVVVRTSRVYWVLDGRTVQRELIRRVTGIIR